MSNGSNEGKLKTAAKEREDSDQGYLTSWVFGTGYDRNDIIFREIEKDFSGKASILELCSQYMAELRTNPDNNARQFQKMAKLFEMGIAPDTMEGHYYGVPLCFRTGDSGEPMSSISNILEILWGSILDGQSPWAGKSFSHVPAEVIDSIALGSEENSDGVLGINHFNKIDFKVPNNASFQVLNILMGLETPTPEEIERFGHEKKGCNFIARTNGSVYPDTPRRVFQLNYRWKNLNNIPPLCWLIDEVVTIGEGLHLGQLLFATERLFDQYDPGRPIADSHYQHFGYFLLFDERWNREARRLFAFLEIPENAPGMASVSHTAPVGLAKLSTFTFETETSAPLDDVLLGAILSETKNQPSILHLLKSYSDRLQDDADNKSPCFSRVQEIFNRGIGVQDMEGYYHGALVSWHSEGIFRLFDVNSLNIVWTGLATKFSTWTGKSFETITGEHLREMTDGHEKGETPTRWGSNTQSTRTFREKFVGNLTEIAHVWNEAVPKEEAVRNGYDVKNFFFIGRSAPSLNSACRRKTVYQLNYRWPRLKTIIPDCFCIDELVQIAQGLYLGQLLYATNVVLPYDPARDPEEYKYGNFGFFLLMDDEWHQLRLRMGYDLSNA
jgi:hypothetical protein